jgi:Bax protein
MMSAALQKSRTVMVRVAAGLALVLVLFGIVVVGRAGLFAADPAGLLARREAFLPAMIAIPTPVPPLPDLGAEALHGELASRGYTLEGVRMAEVDVPRLYAARLPTDLSELDSIDIRKQVFVKLLLPLILAENERILADRERLLRLRDQAQTGEKKFEPADTAWLEAISDRYSVKPRFPEAFPELVRRVDAVPPSLAVAQAALETGWGTSAVAQRSHAMFGQMVVISDSDRLAVRRFGHLAHAVEAYAVNLNTHKAYSRFRAKRADQRAKGQVPDGYELAQTLSSYSERKTDYIRDVRGIMRANRLRPLDAARLRD